MVVNNCFEFAVLVNSIKKAYGRRIYLKNLIKMKT